ncbi:MAG TPA: hypothetical protein VD789_01485 [Thermomicrobiales bacterium]|nr:hypothetical protein [Thermomicrobiales bacterium]
MNGLGCGLSLLAGLFLLIGMIPLLGWLNWLTTLPLAILAAIFSYQNMKSRPEDAMAKIGLIASVLIFAFGAFRLSLGAGIL